MQLPLARKANEKRTESDNVVCVILFLYSDSDCNSFGSAQVRDEDVRIMVLPWADLYEVGDGNPPYFGRYPVRNTAWTPWVPDCIPIEGPKFVDVYPAEGVKGYTAMPEGNWNSATKPRNPSHFDVMELLAFHWFSASGISTEIDRT